jgi:putative transposase
MVSRLPDETIRSITSTRVPTCQPEDSPAAVLEGLVGRTWESANTISVLDGQTLVGRIDIVDLLQSADATLVSELMESADARFSGRELTHNLREFEKVRGGLQQTGTRSAHRTLEQSSGRELRYVRDVLHRASNAIVDEARRYECDVIAFEDLTNIRERTGASWGHKWAFRTLYEQVEYKAETVGVSVKQVGSAYTSIRCAECGFTADENRPARNDFHCVKCESEANADYNAAKNIGMRYVRRGQQSFRRTGNSQLAPKSGTVTPSGGFTAHPEGFKAEFMDKPHPPRANPSG